MNLYESIKQGLKEQTMKKFDYNELSEEDFDDMVIYGPNDLEIHGRFTNSRIDKSTLPENIYAYDMREAESGLSTIEKNIVTVDFGGTFLCETEINFQGKDFLDILSEESEWSYSFE